MMAWTLMTSTHPGGAPFSGRSGGTIPGCALGQVRHYFLNGYNDHMKDPDDERNAEKDRSKTIKTPVHITMDETGEPVVPPMVPGRGYGAKTVQTAIRKYCLAHIRKPYLNYLPN
jgi:hypothetical protein